jgi:hypothetical protein
MTTSTLTPRSPSVARRRIGIESLPVDALLVDWTYQRQSDPLWVSKQAKRFDQCLLRLATVSRRADGSNYLVDGQGRRLLCQAVGHPALDCEVYEGLTLAEEAALFRGLNQQRSMRYIDKMRAAIQAGEPDAVGISAACAAAGFGVADALPGGGYGLRCAQALETAYRRHGPQPLTQALRVLSRAYGNGPGAGHKDLLVAVASLIAKNDHIDMERLYRALITESTQYLYWVAEGKTGKAFYGSPAKATEAAIGRAYNVRLRARGKIRHAGDQSSDAAAAEPDESS